MEKRLTHGGDWQSYLDKYGEMPLDFSANVSPLGVPAGVTEAIRKAADKLELYPDPLARELSVAIARHCGVKPAQVLCGGGGADLIYRAALGLAPRRALVTAPAFAEYEDALQNAGCEVLRFPLKEGENFRVGPEILDALREDIDMVFLCEPNNPTGVTTDPELLAKIAKVCREREIILFLDESFNEFLEDPEGHSMMCRLEEFPNMLILRAFTKLYAMAGARLGYLLTASPAAMEKMRAAGQPWAVSELAQEAGLAALKETEYVERVRALVLEERGFVQRGLENLGLAVIPGEANYFLFRGPADLADRMEAHGILLRRCDNYCGLGPGWFRTAVRTHAENERLLRTMEIVLMR
ncbi:histidinol-phosphate transaminase [Eubacterium sp. AB3007]|uniref:pyridoxal phosphate-dependent aminotransferase n=1 Tax=Eubacterium sp. AB3007 TaxID=1392487 RepID=UPI0004829359|nr:threonine-phosphate decarboxylase [Eubacterium sp. AB3007]